MPFIVYVNYLVRYQRNDYLILSFYICTSPWFAALTVHQNHLDSFKKHPTDPILIGLE